MALSKPLVRLLRLFEGDSVPPRFPIPDAFYQWKIYVGKGCPEFKHFGTVYDGACCWGYFVCGYCMTTFEIPDLQLDCKIPVCKYCWSF